GELVYGSGQWFFSMELVRGVDFVRWVRRAPAVAAPAPPPPAADDDTLRPGVPPDASEAAGADGRALDEARPRAGLAQLCHEVDQRPRDIKRATVPVAEGGVVVLLDCGLVAEAVRGEVVEPRVVGTLAYMSPEQAAARPIGPASDWYSVGVLIYECLAGRRP